MLKVTYRVRDDYGDVDFGTDSVVSLNLMFGWLCDKAKGALRAVTIREHEGFYDIGVTYFFNEKRYDMTIAAVENEDGVVFSDGSYFPRKHCARYVQEWLDRKRQEMSEQIRYVV